MNLLLTFFFATLAQLVERLTCNEDVVSSTLTGGSIFSRLYTFLGLCGLLFYNNTRNIYAGLILIGYLSSIALKTALVK